MVRQCFAHFIEYPFCDLTRSENNQQKNLVFNCLYQVCFDFSVLKLKSLL